MSYAILAGTVGALLAGMISEKVGKKPAILLADLYLIAGAIILSISIGPISLCLGRLLIGFGFGITSMVTPIYLSESSPTSLRN